MTAAIRRPLRGPGAWALLVSFVLLAALASLCMGHAKAVGPGDVLAALTGQPVEPHVSDIVETVRLPRVVLGLLVGAALSIAGALFQALLRNDLAEPYLLGVGPGALLGVTAAAVIGASGSEATGPAWLRGTLAFAGAIGVALIVFSFARRSGRMVATTVLLAGIAVGAFVSALATAALHAVVSDWHLVVRWLLGNLTLADFDDVALLGAVVVVGGLVAFVRARDLDVLTLGEEAAWLGGVEVRRALWLLGGVACLLSGAAVALCGLVGFVGLVVPHLARRLFGPGHRVLLPAAALLGAALLVLADGLSRSLLPPEGFPLGVVTALLGAPVLVALLLRKAA